MAEWFYTTNNQQMGPVSWDELRQLASSGLLLPADMVWKEGMVDWRKASKTEGLFSERAAPQRNEQVEDRSRRRAGERSEEVEDRSRRRSRDRNDEDDDYDDRPRRRRRPASTGMPLGAKVAIIGGSIAVGLLILVVILVLLLRGGAGGMVGPGQFQITLLQGREHHRTIQFNQGQRVTITVTTQAVFNPDVDLFVMRNNGQMVASDTRVDKNCFVQFVAPATDTYRIRIVNLGPGTANSTVNIQ